MSTTALYAEVILPLALKGTFTYVVPQEFHAQSRVGMRVMVQFGKQKIYSGIITDLHHKVPEHFEPKPVLSLLDDEPLVTELQLQFWKWLSDYYMCTMGEVMHAALPAGLKLASETVLQIYRDGLHHGMLDDEEQVFLEYLEDAGRISLNDIRKSTFGNEGLKLVKRLVDKGVIITDQHLFRSFKPRKVTFIGLTPEYGDEKNYISMLDRLKRAAAQAKAMEIFAELSGWFGDAAPKDVQRSELTDAGVSAAAITGLIKKGVFRSFEKIVSRIHHEEMSDSTDHPASLEDFQQKALDEISQQFQKLPAVLLHGITSSGKTELYIHLIRKQLEQGKQVLYLLPEIALTTQIIKRLKVVFGEKIGVYHSKYSDNERVEVYRNLAGLTDEEPYSVILGVRSAVFLPFQNLGLVIVDEEHENTYKQHDPAPRYHARDAATILGLFNGARILMGTATPSFESLYNTMSGKYGIVKLEKRYGDVEIPEVIIADIARARKRKQLRAYFTPELIGGMQDTLEAGRQVILFQNRRGYSNYLHCGDCGHIIKCQSCDVSLTYHKYIHEMLCHYCGFRMPVPVQCPECHGSGIQMRGFGTEKIEDEINSIFPDAKVGRLDLDKTRSRRSFEKLISDFERGRIQVLVGTQLVTKGLDFDHVGLVGIIDADSMLNFPDFRAFERSFQLMVQVSGRAGRRKERGKVIIQTMDPEHPVIQRVLGNAFDAFFEDQMKERKMFRYPPYTRLIRITIKHEIPSILDGGAVFLANELREIFGGRVLGPQPPMVSKTHGKYIRQIMLKIEKEASFEKAKKLIGELLEIFTQNPVYRQIRLSVDVDPL